jgi:hypothetical protein
MGDFDLGVDKLTQALSGGARGTIFDQFGAACSMTIEAVTGLIKCDGIQEWIFWNAL